MLIYNMVSRPSGTVRSWLGPPPYCGGLGRVVGDEVGQVLSLVPTYLPPQSCSRASLCVCVG